MTPKKFNKEIEREIVNKYKNKKSTVYLSKEYNTSANLIRRLLIRNNVTLRSNSENSKKYKINEEYFKNIDTPEKSYFLGLLFADGNMAKNSSSVSISLIHTDSYLLYYYSSLFQDKPLRIIKERFKKFNNKIYKSKAQIKLEINNKKIYEYLQNFGLFPNKSLNLKFPDNLDKKLYKYFILGYFDGDGCISQSIYKKGQNTTFNIAGTKEFIKKIQEILIENCKINETKIIKHNNIFYIRHSGRQNVEKIYNYFYKDGKIKYFLNRKKEKFEKIINYTHIK